MNGLVRLGNALGESFFLKSQIEVVQDVPVQLGKRVGVGGHDDTLAAGGKRSEGAMRGRILEHARIVFHQRVQTRLKRLDIGVQRDGQSDRHATVRLAGVVDNDLGNALGVGNDDFLSRVGDQRREHRFDFRHGAFVGSNRDVVADREWLGQNNLQAARDVGHVVFEGQGNAKAQCGKRADDHSRIDAHLTEGDDDAKCFRPDGAKGADEGHGAHLGRVFGAFFNDAFDFRPNQKREKDDQPGIGKLDE